MILDPFLDAHVQQYNRTVHRIAITMRDAYLFGRIASSFGADNTRTRLTEQPIDWSIEAIP